MAQLAKSLPALLETQVPYLGQEDPLEKEMATFSNVLAWELLWTEEPGGIQPMGSGRVGHSLGTKGTYLLVYIDIQQAFPKRVCGGCCVTENFGL